MTFSSFPPDNGQLSATGLPFELLLNNIEAIIYLADINTYHLLFINEYGRKYFGESADKLCWQALYPDQKEPCDFCTNDKLLDENNKPGPPCAWEFKDPLDGTVFKVLDRAILLDNNILAKLSVATSSTNFIPPAKETYNPLTTAREDWEEVFDTINEAITIHDANFNIVRANHAAEEILGLKMDSILQLKCYESYHSSFCPPTSCPSCQSLKNGLPSVTKMYEPSLKKHLEIKALPRCNQNDEVTSLVHIVRDITIQEQKKIELKKLQKQLARSQKLEAIGHLAGGVAHDFNNLLTGILGFTGLAIDQTEENDPLYEDLQEVKTLAKRAADLTRQLLTFSQRQPAEPIEIDLNNIVENLAKMLRRMLGKDIELILNLAENAIKIIADPGQIEQIIANLSVNSRQAMPNGGTLTIHTGSLQLTGNESFFAASDITPGEYALLEVTDTGCGMEDAVQEQIFEPFFTTKDVGQGSGLGMSMIYGIVQEHNGYIKVFSKPGVGSTISILTPLAVDDRLETQLTSKSSSENPNDTKTILLVDDDDHILRLLKKILHKLGYNVISADNVELAQSLMEQNAQKIDLALLDVIMPHKSGKELYDQLIKISPDLKVVFMTGHSAESEFIRQIIKSNSLLIEKPISFTNLADTLKMALEK